MVMRSNLPLHKKYVECEDYYHGAGAHGQRAPVNDGAVNVMLLACCRCRVSLKIIPLQNFAKNI